MNYEKKETIRRTLPLSGAWSARNGEEAGTFVVSLVETFTLIFIRKVITVCFSVAAQGLADAASWKHKQGLTFTKTELTNTVLARI